MLQHKNVDAVSYALGKKGRVTIDELDVTENGTYTAADGEAFSPVKVNVPSAVIEELDVTANGTYTASAGHAYSPVVVNVSAVTVETLTVTENGTYTAPTGKAYSPITVNVPAGAPRTYQTTVFKLYELGMTWPCEAEEYTEG